jgi:hypothetical protein
LGPWWVTMQVLQEKGSITTITYTFNSSRNKVCLHFWILVVILLGVAIPEKKRHIQRWSCGYCYDLPIRSEDVSWRHNQRRFPA